MAELASHQQLCGCTVIFFYGYTREGTIKGEAPYLEGAEIKYCPLHRSAEKLREACEALPLKSFGEDMSKCDAADFVDHAGEFFEAMVKARAALAAAQQEERAK